MWNVADTLAISADQRRTLQAWIAAGSTPQKVVFRSRIVLLAAEGMANRKIAQQLHTSRPTVILWRRRFKVGGPAALTKDAAGRGRKPRIPPEKVEQILEATLKTTPLGATRWSVRTMAAAQGVSPATVQRIWQTQGLGTRRNADFGPNKRLLEKSNDSYSVGETARIEPIAENLKPSKVVLETAAGAQRFKRVSRLEWEDYPNYAARMEFLLALRNKWPKFWCSLNATWRSQDPTRLEQWTREYHVINEDERLSNRWLLDDVVLPTLAYWSESPDSPDARLQPNYPWFCYPPDRFLPFPEFRPVLTDARPRPIAPVADFKEQIAAMQQRPLGDDEAGHAATAELRTKFGVEPDKEFQARILKQVKQQLASWNRALRKNTNYPQVTPQLRVHARLAVRRMRGDSLEEVAKTEPNSSFLFVDHGDRAQTIVRQARRFTREADLHLPPWVRESRQRKSRRSTRA